MGISISDYNNGNKFYFTISQINTRLLNMFNLPITCDYLKWFCLHKCPCEYKNVGGMGYSKRVKTYEIHQVIERLRYTGINVPKMVGGYYDYIK